jgi:endonuclease/exonuclease/phosphatase family metal-dependent hydrolase
VIPALSGIVRGVLDIPAPTERPVIHGDAPVLPSGRSFTVVCWNIQFCGSRRYRFFYDGGRQVSVPRDVVEETAAKVGEAIARYDADFVLLQEVDRHSRRTAYVDQMPLLLAKTQHPTWTSTPYHRNRYVPHPSFERMGRVDMHLAVLSRWKIASARRIPLPLLAESRARRLFNLRRAILDVRVPRGEGSLALLDTHLSAFSRGDGTLDRQVTALQGAIAGISGSWILGGDMNALAPGDDPQRLPDPDEYPEAVSPIAPLLAWPSTWDAAKYAADPKPYYSYLPFGAAAADRTLDWVFHSGTRLLSWEIPSDIDELSDHRPIVARFSS